MSRDKALGLVSPNSRQNLSTGCSPRLKLQLRQPEIFRTQAYVDGQWVEAKSGEQFDVIGMIPPVHPEETWCMKLADTE